MLQIRLPSIHGAATVWVKSFPCALLAGREWYASHMGTTVVTWTLLPLPRKCMFRLQDRWHPELMSYQHRTWWLRIPAYWLVNPSAVSPSVLCASQQGGCSGAVWPPDLAIDSNSMG